ncbi:MAG: glycosyltransferase family 87 protein [Anaerolineaceae bacterium]|nr:glycosyltransferase family 87 protein [Brevefilum sp.]
MMMKRYRRTALSQYITVVLVFVLIIGFGILGFLSMTHIRHFDAFAIPWAAGRGWLLEGVSPYELSVIDIAYSAVDDSPFLAQLQTQQLFSQPLFSLVFYLPLSLLPYTLARSIWTAILAFCVALIGYFSIKLSGWQINRLGMFCVAIFLIFSLPGAIAVLGGDISPMIIVLLLFSIFLIQSNQDTPAGFLLVLASSSFLISGLVVMTLLIWAIVKKRWSIIASFFSGVVFLVIISFLVQPLWFEGWISVLIKLNFNWSWVRTPLMDLAAFLPGIAKHLSIFLHGLFGVFAIRILITLLVESDRVFIYAIASMLSLAYFLHIRASTVNTLLIVPSLIFVTRYWSERWKRSGALISWVFLAASGVGSWLLVYPEIDLTNTMNMSWVFIVYSLAVLSGMIWIRWWALGLPKLPYESL